MRRLGGELPGSRSVNFVVHLYLFIFVLDACCRFCFLVHLPTSLPPYLLDVENWQLVNLDSVY